MGEPARQNAAKEPTDGLTLLRTPFPPNQISKLPKESKAQADERKADRNKAINCQICGGWHHRNAVHLDYVGHAALTDRLLDADPNWAWEPMTFTPEGLPAFDRTGGLWIKLTVCGVTRLGYGCADGKSGGDAVKEIIGDGLRNAAMRFGAALDLWHKGDLHAPEDNDTETDEAAPAPAPKAIMTAAKAAIDVAETMAELDAWKVNNGQFLAGLERTDLAAYNGMVAHWKGRAKIIKARTPPAAKAAFPGSFDDVTDEAAAALNERAAA